jgi:protein O-GlcNAc transferase
MTLQEQFESGRSHHHAGRLAEAGALYRQILAHQPDHAEALYMLGVLLEQTGQFDAGVELIRRAIRITPDNAEAYNFLGVALDKNKQIEEAIVVFRQAIRLRPDYAEAHHNLGIALLEMRQIGNAIAAYREAIRLKPDYVDAYYNLGTALKHSGQFADAIAAYRQAIRLWPGHTAAHMNLGSALISTGQVEEAVAAFRCAVRSKPDLAEAHNNLGNALKVKGEIEEAIAAHRQALRLKPRYPEAFNNLGASLKEIGRLDEAVAAYREAIRLKPDYTDAHSNLVYALQFHSGYGADMIFVELRRWNQQHAEPLRKFIQPFTNSGDPDRRLRIGYVSADFRNHSVGRFLLPLFREHDHGAYEIICYFDSLKSDDVTDRLRACADGWHDIVGWTDERVADKVREDKIDILVDLAGHTAGNRLKVFGRKPAPVEVSYLGYPGSTGLSEMDYRLTDSLADPPGKTESFHTETLVRLPVCNWCFGEPDDAPPVGPLPAESNGSICFGTFNNFAKASPVIVDLWAEILNVMPSSRLIIKSRGLGETSVREQIQQSFATHGVQADRLEIRGHEPKVSSHLEMYNRMDIALDTFPYQGTTTTCEALWMGVPVITLAGSTHVSRVGVSLLNCVGLPELIAQTPEQYVESAISLAKDLPRLGELRRSLRARMQSSPLMDAPRFARDVEAAYRQMWRNWVSR